MFGRYKNKVLYDGREIVVTDKILYRGNKVEIIEGGIVVGSLSYGQEDSLSQYYVFRKNKKYIVHLDKLWVEPGYRHGTKYARDMIYYVLSLYEKLDKVTLTAHAEPALVVTEGQEPLSQEALESFYKKFTYGVGSKQRLLE